MALENYGAVLNKIREELKDHVVPAQPLAPNEFQSRLRQAILSTTERARANRVKLPENFYLGFDEFVAALPANEKEAQRLGQELQQIELLIAILIDAKVDGITALKTRDGIVGRAGSVSGWAEGQHYRADRRRARGCRSYFHGFAFGNAEGVEPNREL